MARIAKTLGNPFLLGAEGFVVGAILFFAAHPEAVRAHLTAPAAATQSQAAR